MGEEQYSELFGQIGDHTLSNDVPIFVTHKLIYKIELDSNLRFKIYRSLFKISCSSTYYLINKKNIQSNKLLNPNLKY